MATPICVHCKQPMSEQMEYQTIIYTCYDCEYQVKIPPYIPPVLTMTKSWSHKVQELMYYQDCSVEFIQSVDNNKESWNELYEQDLSPQQAITEALDSWHFEP
jgi:hypothetical protein